jgi:hypothetical protein
MISSGSPAWRIDPGSFQELREMKGDPEFTGKS